MKPALTWLTAAAVALLLAAIGPALDGLPEAVAEADAARLARDIDLTQQRMERAAASLCRAELGPHATAALTPEGRLVCTAHSGARLLAATTGPTP
jgi:hypothetical protein